jgi:hypothetical protein
MTAYVSRPGQRAGADCCPGVDERGHGLTVSDIHDSQCCEEWESGVASPDRAEAFSQAAARWGSEWPAREAGHEAGRDEPEAEAEVSDRYDLWRAGPAAEIQSDLEAGR